MQLAQPKRVGEMQARQFQEGDRLQEGPREKSKEQESLFWVSKGSNLASSHCHSTRFYRPDTEVGPWPILAHLLFTTRYYCTCLEDEETEEQRQYLRAHLRPEETASGELTSSVRERVKGADSLPHPPHSARKSRCLCGACPRTSRHTTGKLGSMDHVPHLSAARNPLSGDVGTVDRRTAPLAVASTCGRPLHVISGPPSILSIFRGCGKG